MSSSQLRLRRDMPTAMERQSSYLAELEELFKAVSGTDALKKVREQAWEKFQELIRTSKSFPGEELRELSCSQLLDQKTEGKALDALLDPESQGRRLVFFNGSFRPELSSTRALKEDRVVLLPLDTALVPFGALLMHRWANFLREEQDPLSVLNLALMGRGALLYVPPDSEISVPLEVIYAFSGEPTSGVALPRLELFVGKGATASFTFKNGPDGTGKDLHSLVDLTVDEEASVSFTGVDLTHGRSVHTTRALLKKKARLESTWIAGGSAHSHYRHSVTLAGEEAEASVKGLALLQDSNRLLTHVSVDHRAARCRSRQLFKAILAHESRSHYQGRILVSSEAKETDADQRSHHLLVGEKALGSSQPILDIFADDVKVSHGSTMGTIDEEQMFYLRSRGILAHEATTLLLESFCHEIVHGLSLADFQHQWVHPTNEDEHGDHAKDSRR